MDKLTAYQSEGGKMESYQELSRLGYLMDLFHVKGMELADYLHVDTSLISKLKTGKRKINTNSEICDEIVDFFIMLDKRLNYASVKGLLMEAGQASKETEASALKVLLKRWLVEENDANSSFTDKTVYTTKVKIFQGKTGRRKAAQEFIQSVLLEKTAQDVYVLDWTEHYSWQSEDTEFFKEWKKQYLKIAEKGHRIVFLISLNHSIDYLINTLLYRLPMLLTGNVQYLYYPVYSPLLYKHNIVVLKNKMALVKIAADEITQKDITHMYTDYPTVRHYEELIKSAYTLCKKSHEVIHHQEIRELIKKLPYKLGNTYVKTKMPFSLVTTSQNFECILAKNDMEEEEQRALREIHKIHHKKFSEDVVNFKYCLLVNKEALIQGLHSEMIPFHELTLFTGREITVYKQDVYRQIEYLIWLLVTFPNFNVAFYRSGQENLLDGLNLWLNENGPVIINQEIDDDSSIIMDEPSICTAFYVYAKKYWYSIPSVEREKESVIRQLKNMLLS